MKKLWFKRKVYGWGWQPNSYEGWTIILIYIGYIIWKFKSIDNTSHSISDTLLNFVVPYLIATLLLIFICYLKGERPKWQWGEEKSSNN